MTWTPYECDLVPAPAPRPPVVILRQSINDWPGRDGEIIYALQDGSSWLVFRIDVRKGTSQAAREPYRCFIEAKRAVDAGAVTWEG